MEYKLMPEKTLKSDQILCATCPIFASPVTFTGHRI